MFGLIGNEFCYKGVNIEAKLNALNSKLTKMKTIIIKVEDKLRILKKVSSLVNKLI